MIGALALGATAAAQTTPLPDPCAGDPSCRQASAAELFAAAEALAKDGNLEAAESILAALTQDPSLELRTEARFRLAAVREMRGDRAGAVQALRALLEEKPDAQRARLELGRILAALGDDSGARREFRRASTTGLPRDVARTVRRFSTALQSLKRRGATLDLALGLDSNVNRATSDQFVDTVIAPFELSTDARVQSGVGLTIGGEAWSRDPVLGTTLLTRAAVRGDLFVGKGRFNDIQTSVSTGPELTTGTGRIRPALLLERRWYGRDRYSTGYGAAMNWLATLGTSSQLQVDGSVVRQSIHRGPALDGHRYTLSIAYDRSLTPDTTARIAVRGAALDAAAHSESLRQAGGDALVAHMFGFATVFAQAGYSRTEARAVHPFFGKARQDDRIDLGAGMIVHRLDFGGFTPLLRFIHTDSRSNIALYDFRRSRLEVGLTRDF